MTQARPVTITTIAQEAGVSIASVSRVLNGLPTRPATKRRVREAAERLGYVPNHAARSLQSRRTGQVAFAMADISNPVYQAMTRQIQHTLRAGGYRLLLHSTDGDVKDEQELLDSLAQRYVDGLIICPIRITEDHLAGMRATSVPVVAIGWVGDEPPVDSVLTDASTGIGLAVQHLYQTGKRRIAFLNGPLDTVPGQERLRGYRSGLARAGLGYDESLVVTRDFYRADGAAMASELLESTPDVDALVCANDMIAIGALDVLRERGTRVPEEIAVVGMDDTDLATICWRPLTSVSLGSVEQARVAAAMLLDRLTADRSSLPMPARVASIPPRLVVRASSDPEAVG
jgi:LacI family transcriptional regulator